MPVGEANDPDDSHSQVVLLRKLSPQHEEGVSGVVHLMVVNGVGGGVIEKVTQPTL